MLRITFLKVIGISINERSKTSGDPQVLKKKKEKKKDPCEIGRRNDQLCDNLSGNLLFL